MECGLELKNISYLNNKEKKLILNDASYSFENGKIYGLVEQNFDIKSMLLVLTGGFKKPQSGTIVYKGKELKQIGLTNYRQQDLALIFKDNNLIHYLNAYENVLNSLTIANLKKRNKKDYCLKTLMDLGLNKEDCFKDVTKLTKYQYQLVVLACALVRQVEIIVADEIIEGLNQKEANDLVELLINLAHQGRCIIVMTRLVSLAQKFDVQLKIIDGQIVRQ